MAKALAFGMELLAYCGVAGLFWYALRNGVL